MQFEHQFVSSQQKCVNNFIHFKLIFSYVIIKIKYHQLMEYYLIEFWHLNSDLFASQFLINFDFFPLQIPQFDKRIKIFCLILLKLKFCLLHFSYNWQYVFFISCILQHFYDSWFLLSSRYTLLKRYFLERIHHDKYMSQLKLWKPKFR